MRFLRTAKRCRVIVVFLCLVFSPRAFAQFLFDPADTNIRPVRITSPANHSTFYTPVDVSIFAYVHVVDQDVGAGVGASFTNVEFFAGTNDLGSGLDLGSTHAALKPVYANFVIAKPVVRLGSVYCFVWTNATAGNYSLTAVASGHEFLTSLSRTSAPVNITILTATTNTNPTDIVSIVATDPIAIADTNAYWFWPGVTNAVPAWTNWPPTHWGYTTNWGPKNALFTVSRFGDASADLTVNYNISGTASNGVDYAMLTNFVTIPAGEAYAMIPVVPVDNGATNFAKTVVLALTSDTNTPPNYIVGNPPRAVALILDNWPRLFPFMLPDGRFHFNVGGTNGGPDGAWFSAQISSDLQNWSSVSTNQIFQGSIDFVDPDGPNNPIRFYRALPLTNTPAD